MRPFRSTALVLVPFLLLAACGDATDDSPPAGGQTEEATPLPDEDDEDEPMGDEDLREETQLAIEDAADERGLTEDAIEVLRAEHVEWPDGARGCPEEGEMYTQAIVPGYLIVLDVEGEEVFYHGADGEPPFHCEDPQSPTQGS